MRVSLCLAVSGGLSLVACGAEPEVPVVTPPSTPPSIPAVDACAAFTPALTPIPGTGPLHRTTAITARWGQGIPPDVVFDVSENGEAARGVAHVRDGQALFLPERAFPKDARVEWTFSACGVKKTGSFTTGTLMAPADVDVTVGRSFGFDLRTAAWEQPTAASTTDGFILRWHLAPAFVVDVLEADLGQATLALAPGVLDDDGRVVRDLRAGHTVLSTSLLENPYLHASAPALSLMGLDGEVVLKDLELVLGLGDGCFTDTRLVAVMDVRHLEKAGKAPCARLMSLTGETCVPCDEGDTEAGCFLLAVSGLASVSDVDSTVPAPAPAPQP